MASMLSPADQHLSLPSPPASPSPPPTSNITSHKPLLLSRPTNTAARGFPATSLTHEITFYNPGDLLLSVPSPSPNGQCTTLRVASAALCIASPVFRAMLAPGRFSEGNSFASAISHNQPFALDLPDDDLDSLIVLCNLLHHHHHKIPRHISVEALARLCVLLDKYVCTLAAASWLDYWFAHMPLRSTIDNVTEIVQWVYISHVAGDAGRFRFYTSLYASAMANPEYMSDAEGDWFDRLPEPVQDRLAELAGGMMEQATTLVNEFLEGTLVSCRVDGRTHSPRSSAVDLSVTSETCNAHAVGSVLRGLQAWNTTRNTLSVEVTGDTTSPPPKPTSSNLFALLSSPVTHWRQSAKELVNELEAVAKRADDSGSRWKKEKHEQCHQARVLFARLRELRMQWGSGTAGGLELAKFKGRGGGFGGPPSM